MGVAGCGATDNRPLFDSEESHAVAALLRELPGVDAAPRVEAALVTALRGSPVEVEVRGAAAASLGALEPEDVLFDLGPTPQETIGLPLWFDFGVGEAPYDDGTTPLHRGCVGRGGFSDTVLSLVWRQPVSFGVSLHARAAVAKEQDLALLEGLPEARFAFAVLGLGISF